MRTREDTPETAAALARGACAARPDLPWINPIGGLGDTLMLTGVLKQVLERDASRRFQLVRRPAYLALLEGHPAIAGVGFPGRGSAIQATDYWSREPLGGGRQRAMQVLGRMFGLVDGVEERFHVAHDDEPDPLLDWIPWGRVNVVIAPGSAAPRKQWGHERWEELCTRLRQVGCFVVQIGDAKQRHVRSAYSLLGLTRPGQVFPLLRRADLIVTVDCFLMHAAHHVGLPAIVLWGPTEAAVYGYPEQVHLRSERICPERDVCLGPGKGHVYATPCQRDAEHCVDGIAITSVWQAVEAALARPQGAP